LSEAARDSRRRLARRASLAALAVSILVIVTAAVAAARLAESRGAARVAGALEEAGLDWASVSANGLRVALTGTAPSDRARFAALDAAGAAVARRRLEDRMTVRPPEPAAAPAPPAELRITRAGEVVTLAGRVPEGAAPAAVLARRLPGAKLTDLTRTDAADTEGWTPALSAALAAITEIGDGRIRARPGEVRVAARADSAEGAARLKAALAGHVPEGVTLITAIEAPPPLLSPYTLRLSRGPSGARFDACAAPDPAQVRRIVAAAREIGLTGAVRCPVALGVPSVDWAGAATRAIAALGEIGTGTLTISDSEVTLIGSSGVKEDRFRAAVAALRRDLPRGFSLAARRPVPEGPGEAGLTRPRARFLAKFDGKDRLRIEGQVPDGMTMRAVTTFAETRFPLAEVEEALEMADRLPEGWTARILAGLEALSEVRMGTLKIARGEFWLAGVIAREETRARVAGLLAQKLGQGASFNLALRHVPPPPERPDGLSPQACVAAIRAIQEEDKITFDPGSTRLNARALTIVNRIADVLRDCPGAPVEIAGHTDSQGRAEMNLSLSQARAEAVLNALIARRVLTGNITARGYGETQPIADNDSEDGREANRRITFRLRGGTDGAGGAAASEAGGAGADPGAELGTAELRAALRDWVPKPRPDRGER